MKPKKSALSLIALSLILLLSSCHQDPPKLQWEGKYGPLGGLIVCCQVAGNTCYEKGSWFYPPTLKTYVENNNLSGFFQNEDWQSYFPELVDRQDIVDQIINANPKGEFLKNSEGNEIAFAILKDRTKEAFTDNVYIGFKISPDCDKIFTTQ